MLKQLVIHFIVRKLWRYFLWTNRPWEIMMMRGFIRWAIKEIRREIWSSVSEINENSTEISHFIISKYLMKILFSCGSTQMAKAYMIIDIVWHRYFWAYSSNCRNTRFNHSAFQYQQLSTWKLLQNRALFPQVND